MKRELRLELSSKRKVLDPDFFLSEEVLEHAQSLLGKVLATRFDGMTTSGVIVETEAYKAPEDKASHAYGNRRTARTEIMFQRGGYAYVYLIYGIHHLFNIVTGPAEIAHAVLIRAVEPLDNPESMLGRRGMTKLERRLTGGPGVLSRALGIRKEHTGLILTPSSGIWIEEDPDFRLEKDQIISGPRVGIDYAEEWIDKPWRYRLRNSPWTSKG